MGKPAAYHSGGFCVSLRRGKKRRGGQGVFVRGCAAVAGGGAIQQGQLEAGRTAGMGCPPRFCGLLMRGSRIFKQDEGEEQVGAAGEEQGGGDGKRGIEDGRGKRVGTEEAGKG